MGIDLEKAPSLDVPADRLLDVVQRQTLRYFWDFAHPVSGLARERSNAQPDVITSGGSGFGVMAILTGVERGWIARNAALDRLVAKILLTVDEVRSARHRRARGR